MSPGLHIVCPHCETLNRVPPERLAQQPQCGNCHRALFTAHPIELTQASFERATFRSDIPTLVDFWAPWCGPCQMMAPHFGQAAQLLEPRVRLAKVDTESQPQLGAQFQIRSIPTLALFHHGRELARKSGAMGTRDIVSWAQQHLGAVA